MALLFVALSADESISVHERFRGVTEYVLGRERVRGTFDYSGAWFLAVAPPFLALMTWLLLRLHRALPDPTALRLLVLGVGLFSIGAFVLEALGNGFAIDSRRAMMLEVGAEEFAEMAGVTLILWGSARAFGSRYSLKIDLLPANTQAIPRRSYPTSR
jgi:hypothetical protein